MHMHWNDVLVLLLWEVILKCFTGTWPHMKCIYLFLQLLMQESENRAKFERIAREESEKAWTSLKKLNDEEFDRVKDNMKVLTFLVSINHKFQYYS